MIFVHHLENSRSQRVLWLLEELDLQYEVIRYSRQPSLAAPPELKKVHPLGKSPIVQDRSDKSDVTLVETGAICEYLTEKAGRLGNPGPSSEKILYRQFMHYAEGSVMSLLFSLLVANRIPLLGRFASRRLLFGLHIDFIEEELAGRPWFAGQTFTAADVMMSFPLEAARSRSR